MDNQSRTWKDMKSDMDELNAKANELFGNLRMFGKGPSIPGMKMGYHNLIDAFHRLPSITVNFKDGDRTFPHVLDQAQAAYIYAANKQTDGAVKLRAMGISDADVARIKSELDPRVVKFMDWVQEEFLPSRHARYSATYEKLFGVPMTSIENYFPLMIDKMGIKTEKAVDAEGKANNATTVVGSAKERTFNTKALNIKDANVISMLYKHLEEMNHWRNFAEWNRDLNTLLNDSRFKRKIYNVDSIFGSGETLWKHFRDVSLIASGDYIPAGGDSRADRYILNWAKLVSGAKVAFRGFTSTKQALSFLTFVARSEPKYFVKNLANEYGTLKWCFDNMPLFEKRWKGRRAGDPRLEDTDLDFAYTRKKFVRWLGKWGLTPNAAIDLWACAIGSRSVYDTNKEKYIKQGYSEEDAHQRAVQDAQIAFNESQQSSEPMFLAPVQVDRTIQAVGLSTFRSASMGFTRLAYRGVKDIKQSCDFKNMTDNAEYMYKMLRRDGLTPTQTRNVVTDMYKHQAWRGICETFMYAFGAQFMWNTGSKAPTIIATEDDDKTGTIVKEEAIHSAVAGFLEGLPFGNLASDQISHFINSLVENEEFEDAWKQYKQEATRFNDDLLPIVSDMANIRRELFSKEYLQGMTDFLNLVIQANVGVNPKTVTDMAIAILDRCNGDVELAKESLIMWYRIANVPQSQIEDLLAEEVGMTGKDKNGKPIELTADQVAARYVYYQKYGRAPLMWELYNAEQQKELVKKYEDKFYEKLYASMDDPASYRHLVDLSVGRKDKAIKKYVEALEGQGVDALAEALANEKDPLVKAAVSKKYFQMLHPKEQKEAKTNEAMDAKSGDEEDKQLKAAAKYLGPDELVGYMNLSARTTGYYSNNDTLVAKGKELYSDFSVEYTKEKKGKKYEVPLEKATWKLPVKDKKKRAQVQALLDKYPEHFALAARTRWRNNKVKQLIKEIEEDPSKKEKNLPIIRQLIKDNDADHE